MTLSESIIVNCTGLGSKTLFNDNELIPVKGQLTVCVPQPEVNYRASGRVANGETYALINPRSDGIVIGNMHERGNWSLSPMRRCGSTMWTRPSNSPRRCAHRPAGCASRNHRPRRRIPALRASSEPPPS